jgi:hypothetical protein
LLLLLKLLLLQLKLHESLLLLNYGLLPLGLLHLPVLEHHNIELLDVLIRILREVLVYPLLMNPLLLLADIVPGTGQPAQDPQVPNHPWVVPHVVLRREHIDHCEGDGDSEGST